MHVTLLVLLPAFAWLTQWQLGRAESGNTLSWAYTFLWPLFGVYALYLWWHLIHDQSAPLPDGAVADGAAVEPRPPGWALSGGRRRNVAIAAGGPIDPRHGGRGERFASQTAEEAEQLAAYNRYLAELHAADAAGGR